MEPPIEDSRRPLDELDHDELLDAAYGLFRRATLAECEVARLREALNIDKTGLGAGLNRVRAIANGYSWLAEDGVWGSYECEEHTISTLRREIGDALAAIHEAADQSLRQSGDLVQQTFPFNRDAALAAGWEGDAPATVSRDSVVQVLGKLMARCQDVGLPTQGDELCDSLNKGRRGAFAYAAKWLREATGIGVDEGQRVAEQIAEAEAGGEGGGDE